MKIRVKEKGFGLVSNSGAKGQYFKKGEIFEGSPDLLKTFPDRLESASTLSKLNPIKKIDN